MDIPFDFWLGEWTVLADGRVVGSNRIESVLDGFAALEHWRDADGGEGKSLFFFDVNAGTWRQLWTFAGHVKEKTLDLQAPGLVRFAGYANTQRGPIPDRTTLTSLDEGRVHQLIEHSLDGGTTWTTSFDAIYAAAGSVTVNVEPVPTFERTDR